ncbi:Uncharacterised protein [Pantoea agglomerans]|uniref:Molybdenum cofactor biosynthesis protein B n=1 Tax=Enterobacter agglomerans TaxID=549 RepID=A0A379AIN6_ENTAG|nr:Uncharacterised protein [Pantoea agglomerans]
MGKPASEFQAVQIAVMTVSDRRDASDDTSGGLSARSRSRSGA